MNATQQKRTVVGQSSDRPLLSYRTVLSQDKLHLGPEKLKVQYLPGTVTVDATPINQWSRRTCVKSLLVFKPLKPKAHSAELPLNTNAIISANQMEMLQLWLIYKQNFTTLKK